MECGHVRSLLEQVRDMRPNTHQKGTELLELFLHVLERMPRACRRAVAPSWACRGAASVCRSPEADVMGCCFAAVTF